MNTESRSRAILVTYTCLAVALGVLGAIVRNRTLAVICAAMLATAYLYTRYRAVRQRQQNKEQKGKDTGSATFKN